MLPELLVIQHVDREGPDRIANWAHTKGITVQRIRPDQGEALPAVDDQKSAVAVLLGGPMGVNERQQPALHWLEQELAWLKQWLAQGRPALGICLGAQLLCVASGGSIEPLSAGDPAHPLQEVGFGPISWQRSAAEVPWLQGIPPHQLVLHWHGDRCRLSGQAELLASSLHCPEQAFQIGQHAVGLQFHVEASPINVERWIAADQAFIRSAGTSGERIKRDQKRFQSTLEREGNLLLDQLLNHLMAQA